MGRAITEMGVVAKDLGAEEVRRLQGGGATQGARSGAAGATVQHCQGSWT
jgi:hypothetical protein